MSEHVFSCQLGSVQSSHALGSREVFGACVVTAVPLCRVLCSSQPTSASKSVGEGLNGLVERQVLSALFVSMLVCTRGLYPLD